MRSILYILLGAVSYGLLSTFVKSAYAAGFRTDQVVGSQVLLGALMILLLWLASAKFSLRTALNGLSPRVLFMLLPIGLCVGGTSMLYYAALRYIPASIAIVLLFQFTWMGVLIEAVLERKRPGAEKLLALAVVLAGTLMSGGILDGGWRQFTVLGIVFGLLSALTYALFITLSGRTAPGVAPLTRSTFTVVMAAVFILSVYPPACVSDGSLGGGLALWGCLLAFFGVVIPPLCFAIGTPKVGGGLASILSAAELPVAIVMSAVVLQERVTGLQWAGVPVILVGVALPEWLAWRKHTAVNGRQKRTIAEIDS
ncbi:DMT family transporter [Cohnella sp. GCM10020058]|uniref:EamA family transporter n=1 Tax=Cohnella sp. GCM10020058 TaxID=3317330 RepID=UPI003643D9DB